MTLPDIRALVAERQRFDDWLAALETRRAETPVRVFDRVHADYVTRRDTVIEGLHAHVGSLEALALDLNNRLQHVESQLAEREDARAEGILRTAVGEFDNERWEVTRQEVEASIAQLEQDRQALNAEGDDVRSLLASARPTPVAPEPEPEPEPLVVASEPDVEIELVSLNVASAVAHADPAAVEHAIDLNAEGEVAPAADVHHAEVHHAEVHHAEVHHAEVHHAEAHHAEAHHAAALHAEAQHADALHVEAQPTEAKHVEAHHAETQPAEAHRSVLDDLNTTDPYLRAVRRNAEAAADIESAFAVSDEEFQSILDKQHEAPVAPSFTTEHGATSAEVDRDREANAAIDALGGHSVRLPNALDDIDVFGESLATPRANSTDYVAPRSNKDPYAPRPQAVDAPASATPASAAPKRDAFDDLAFLRSVTESGSASAPTAARTSSVTDQAKTLRCTECGTMNFPTEWYCERCGGELATF